MKVDIIEVALSSWPRDRARQVSIALYKSIFGMFIDKLKATVEISTATRKVSLLTNKRKFEKHWRQVACD